MLDQEQVDKAIELVFAELKKLDFVGQTTQPVGNNVNKLHRIGTSMALLCGITIALNTVKAGDLEYYENLHEVVKGLLGEEKA